MIILIIGSGGREHALIWLLAKDSRIIEIWCAPGNAGIAKERLQNGNLVKCIDIKTTDLSRLADFATEKKVHLTVVGPDKPIGLGIATFFRFRKLRIFAPEAALFESSKIFTHAFNSTHGIPQPKGQNFDLDRLREAEAFANSLTSGSVIKADGLFDGKGVVLCKTSIEAHSAIERMLVRDEFGPAGRHILIQNRLTGCEVSAHALCDGKNYKMFPLSQDNKGDGKGNMTGGMGATMRTTPLGGNDAMRIENEIIKPWHNACLEEGIVYKGLFYPGIMLTDDGFHLQNYRRFGPKVLEYNARFGDPETQVYMPMLNCNLLDLLDACVEGTLDKVDLKWKYGVAVCVVMASNGYPDSLTAGEPIFGIEQADAVPDTKVFHAGTALKDGQIVTNGGRVLGVTSWGVDLFEAKSKAYQAVGKIHCQALWYRKDIGIYAP
ncbi:MAG: phosphoribosylamine--glycine ligase [Candidatus Taylorbacteria bacterium RIFCSPLOWO2_02_FULL_43_11]|uniref:phosphoribosylamine--glycine ligase n=1 Tax=Candidatus Taylorbacteria bacterium RIFCSPHIGHO2_02_FULL_43_32b TaxID=1802306 RepID=A0A1G2MM76_9BACT|nr:MAG: phosphoribosylamine--glycine ligase [Candidatus Taylorbacteria bacterium RIFCSPHIGHO2_01_FULL_43_47]OHA24092.1 MAG: phosphoribosylamine--glycine ligase [Candidatus Taylorbacteria bacterium RIFCSPHIGHO2_02_FULL_43_32b]OHA31489.1 MAG: phosphoribosylamine--glycine ligase [Candidatus Taylorbacteria bacterium RIFCSPLOWO2_01_FULL_43_44]OHA37541.1 MAG: phosphoribosylamine--glycine ligase [Candidatus Taylorbacteria bacterium RIFCSPLOWO2_02_FULL_43_11]